MAEMEAFEKLAEEHNIYLIEERSRKLLKYDNEFQLLKTVTLPYSGRLNRGYEGVTHYNGKLPYSASHPSDVEFAVH